MIVLAWVAASVLTPLTAVWALVRLVDYGKRTTAAPIAPDARGPRVIRRDGVNVVILDYRETER